VNERLLLSGFEVREDGKVVTVRAAGTVGEAQQRSDGLRAELARRDVHPDVLAFCRAELLFSTFRNPAAHAPKVAWATSRSDLDMLTLASMLHRRLDKADVRQAAAGSGQP
jgi:hypothetical protein